MSGGRIRRTEKGDRIEKEISNVIIYCTIDCLLWLRKE
jgi:hypothetical protein